MGSLGVTGRKRPFPVTSMAARWQLGARKNKGVGQDQGGQTRAGEKGRRERHRRTPPLRDHEQIPVSATATARPSLDNKKRYAALFYTTVHTSVKTAVWS